MADNPFKRYLDAGIAFTELTQAKAEAIVKDLVRAGEVQTEQAQAVVAELVERSRQNTEVLVDTIARRSASRSRPSASSARPRSPGSRSASRR